MLFMHKRMKSYNHIEIAHYRHRLVCLRVYVLQKVLSLSSILVPKKKKKKKKLAELPKEETLVAVSFKTTSSSSYQAG